MYKSNGFISLDYLTDSPFCVVVEGGALGLQPLPPHGVPDDHEILEPDVGGPGEGQVGVQDVAEAEHATLGVDHFVRVFLNVADGVSTGE